MDEQFYDIRIHFPYSMVNVEKVTVNHVEDIRSSLVFKRPFDVTSGNTEFTINPEMVTYIEFKPHSPW